MARRSLKKTKSVESREAADFLGQYFSARRFLPDDPIIDELLCLADRADSRSTVFGVLNALVETGAIGEFEALSRMSDWKSNQR